MLVALAIMGILLGLVSANVRPSARDLLRVEADRLAQVLDLAEDESRIAGRSLAWTADESGYRFWRLRDDNTWSEISDGGPLRARTLPSGMTISDFRVEAAGPQELKRLEYSPSGDVFAFTLDLSLGNESFTVAASPVGRLRVSPGKGIPYAKMATQ